MLEATAETEAVLTQFEVQHPRAVELASLLSVAAQVEPELLRLARLELVPAADASDEAALWFGPLAGTRGADAICIREDILPLLHRRLAADPHRLDRAAKWLERAHAHAPPLTRLQEQVTIYALRGDDGAVRDALDTVLRHIVSDTTVPAAGAQPESSLAPGVSRADLLAWALVALPKMPLSVQANKAAWLVMLGASNHFRTGIRLHVEPPSSLTSIDIQAVMRDVTSTVCIGIRRTERALHIVPVSEDVQTAIDLPASTPLLLEVSWPGGRRLVCFLCETLRSGPVVVPIPDGAPAVKLCTALGQRFLLAPTVSETQSSPAPFESPYEDIRITEAAPASSETAAASGQDTVSPSPVGTSEAPDSTVFRWLHLSGLDLSDEDASTIRQYTACLRDEFRRMEQAMGPISAIFLSGGLLNGRHSQAVDDALQNLSAALGGASFRARCPLFAVPGEADMDVEATTRSIPGAHEPFSGQRIFSGFYSTIESLMAPEAWRSRDRFGDFSVAIQHKKYSCRILGSAVGSNWGALSASDATKIFNKYRQWLTIEKQSGQPFFTILVIDRVTPEFARQLIAPRQRTSGRLDLILCSHDSTLLTPSSDQPSIQSAPKLRQPSRRRETLPSFLLGELIENNGRLTTLCQRVGIQITDSALRFVLPGETAPLPLGPGIETSGSATEDLIVTNRRLRWLLERCCRTLDDLDSFALDYFPEVYAQWTAGMDRLTKTNALLRRVNKWQLIDHLKVYAHNYGTDMEFFESEYSLTRFDRTESPPQIKTDPPALMNFLQRILPTAADFEAYLIDYFPEILERTEGFDRSRTEHILLERVPAQEIIEALWQYDPAKYRHASAGVHDEVQRSAAGFAARLRCLRIRALLGEVLRTSSDFDAFVLDYFVDTYRRLGSGQDRVARTNLLFLHQGHAAVLDTMRRAEPARLDSLISVLSTPAIPLPQPSPPQFLARLRDSVLRTDADIDALAIDFFPEAAARFSSGMNRDTKLELLDKLFSVGEQVDALWNMATDRQRQRLMQ